MFSGNDSSFVILCANKHPSTPLLEALAISVQRYNDFVKFNEHLLNSSYHNSLQVDISTLSKGFLCLVYLQNSWKRCRIEHVNKNNITVSLFLVDVGGNYSDVSCDLLKYIPNGSLEETEDPFAIQLLLYDLLHIGKCHDRVNEILTSSSNPVMFQILSKLRKTGQSHSYNYRYLVHSDQISCILLKAELSLPCDFIPPIENWVFVSPEVKNPFNVTVIDTSINNLNPAMLFMSLRAESTQEDVQTLKSIAQAESAAHRFSALLVPQIGTVCIAYCLASNDYQRALILSNSSPGTYTVRFIDSNTEQQTSSRQLFRITPNLVSTPALAFKTQIDCGTAEIAKTANSILLGQALTVQLLKPIEDVCFETLISSSDPALSQLLSSCNLQHNFDMNSANQLAMLQNRPFQCTIPHVKSPDRIYVQPLKNKEQLDALMISINDENFFKKVPVHSLNSTQIYAAVYPDDGALYRAMVIEDMGLNVIVKYVDYGNESQISRNDVFQLHDDLTKIPVQCISCSLSLDHPDWDPQHTQLLQTLLGEEAITCIIRRRDSSNRCEVEFTDTPSGPVNFASFSKSVGSIMPGASTKQPSSKDVPFKKLNPDRKTKIPVILISVTSASDFGLHLSSDVEEYSKMSKALYQYAESSSATFGNLTKGNLCAVYSEGEGEWTRAEIHMVKPGGGQFEVTHIDYGDGSVVPQDVCKPLHESFLKLPRQAILCCLYGYSKTMDSAEASEYLEELCLAEDGDLLMTVMDFSPQNNMYSVILTQKGKPISINESFFKRYMCGDVSLVRTALQQSSSSTPTITTPSSQQLLSYAPSNVRLGKCQIYCTYVNSPHSFYVQAQENFEHCEKISQLLMEYQPEGRSFTPIAGSSCIAQASDDCWYRGICSNVVSPELVNIYFIDYGNSEEVSVSNIQPVPSSLHHIPAIAFQCKLHDVKPDNGEKFSQRAIDKFESLVLDKEIECTVNSQLGNIYNVSLTINGEAISKLLFPELTVNVTPPSISNKQTSPQSFKARKIYMDSEPPTQNTSRNSFEGRGLSWKDSQQEIWNRSEHHGAGDVRPNRNQSFSPPFKKVPEENQNQSSRDFNSSRRFNNSESSNAQGSRDFKASRRYQDGDNTNELGSRDFRLNRRYQDGDNTNDQGSRDYRSNRRYQDGDNTNDQGSRDYKSNRRYQDGDNTNDQSSRDYKSSRRYQNMEASNEQTQRNFNSNRSFRDKDHYSNDPVDSFADRSSSKERRNFSRKDDGEINDFRKPVSIDDTVYTIDSYHRIINPGKSQLGKVTYADSPSGFYIRLQQDVDIETTLSKLLQNLQKQNASVPSEILVDNCYIAFRGATQPQRVRVLKKMDKYLSVQQIDTGIMASVPITVIKSSTQQICDISSLALYCRLANVEDIGDNWTIGAFKLFKETVKDQNSLEIQFLGKDSINKYVVSIRSGDTFVSDIILDQFPMHRREEIDLIDVNASQLTSFHTSTFNLEVGKSFESSCVFISNEGLYCHLSDSNSNLEEICNLVNGFYNDLKDDQSVLRKPNVGSLCCAKYLEEWYRAIIIDINGDSANVKFVDYGNQETVELSHIKTLIHTLETQPSHAMLCKFSTNTEKFITPYVIKELTSLLIDDSSAIVNISPHSLEPISCECSFKDESISDVVTRISSQTFCVQTIPESNETVTVSYINEQYAYVSLNNVESRTDFLKSFNEHYSNLGSEYNLPSDHVVSGLHVAFLNGESWHRGEIISCDSTIEIIDLDLGSICSISTGDLKYLTREFSAVASFSIKTFFPDLDILSVGDTIEVNFVYRTVLGSLAICKNDADSIFYDLFNNNKCEEMKPILNQMLDCVVLSAKSPQDLIICPSAYIPSEKTQEDLKLIFDKLNEFEEDCNEGDYYLVNTEDVYERAIAVENCEDGVKVLLLDAGYEVTISKESIRNLPNILSKIPRYTKKAALSDVVPFEGDDWQYDDGDILMELLVDHSCSVIFKNANGDIDLTFNSRDIKEVLFNMEIVRSCDSPVPEIKMIPPFDYSLFAECESKDCTISNICKQGFFAQLPSREEDLLKLTDSIAATYIPDKVSDRIRLRCPNVKKACICPFYEEPGSFYRAEILSISENSADVLFVDFGNTQTTKLTDILSIKHQILEQPRFAFIVQFTGISSDILNYDVLKELRENVLLETVLLTNIVVDENVVLAQGTHKNKTLCDFVQEVRSHVKVDPLRIEDRNISAVLAFAKSPFDFYVHKVSNLTDIDNLMETIRQKYSKLEPEELAVETFAKGDCICARSTTDEEWYRAQVIKTSRDDECQDDADASETGQNLTDVFVQFLDYGECQWVPLENIRKLSKELGSSSAFAINCNLFGLTNENNESSESAFSMISSLSDLESFQITVFARSLPLAVDISTGDVESMCQYFIDQAYSLPADTCKSYPMQPNFESAELSLLDLENPSSMSFQFTENLGQISLLLEDIQFTVAQNKCSSLNSAEINSIALVQYAEDELWYRAVATEVSDESVSFLFVDYGNTTEISLPFTDNVKSIHSVFCRLPPQYVNIGLDSVIPFEDEKWLCDDKDYVWEFVIESFVIASVKSRQSNNILCDIQSKEGKSLQQFLRDNKVVRLDDESPFIWKKFEGSLFDVVKETSIEVKLLNADKHGLWVHLVSDANTALDDLSNKLHEHYSKLERTSRQSMRNPKPGKVCVAKFYDDESYYRGEIVNTVDDEQYEVFFVDYANDQVTNMLDIKSPIDDAFSLPKFALRLNIHELDRVLLNFDVIQYLKQLQDETLRVSIIDVDEDTKTITGDIFLNDQLLSNIIKDIHLNPQVRVSKIEEAQLEVTVRNVVSPAEIFVTINNEKEQLNTFESILAERYSSLHEEELLIEKLTPDDYAVCLNESAFGRVKIIDITDEEVTVRRIDYGNKAVVEKSSLRKLCRQLIRPAFTHQLALFGINPIEDQYSTECIEFINEYVDQTYVAFIFSNFILFNIETTPVTQILADNKFAAFTPSTSSLDSIELKIHNMTFLSATSPSHMVFQFIDSFQELESAEYYIRMLYDNASFSHSSSFDVGSLCVTKFSDDLFYRAKVTAIENNTATVYFIDWGNDFEVDVDNLLPLPSEFPSLPPQSVVVTLAEVSPIEDDVYLESDKTVIEKVLESKTCVLEFIDENAASVSFSDEDNTINLKDILQKEHICKIKDALDFEWPSFAVSCFDLNVGDDPITMNVCSIERECFYLQLPDQSEQAEELSGKITEYFVGNPSLVRNLRRLKPGRCCIVKCPTFETFERAEIINVLDESVLVNLVDYGTRQDTPLSDVFEVVEDFVATPRSVLEADVGISSDHLTKAVLFELRSLFTGAIVSKFSLQITSIDDKCRLTGVGYSEDSKLSEIAASLVIPPTFVQPPVLRNRSVEATIVHIESPCEFYMQMSDEATQLEELTTKLNEHYSALPEGALLVDELIPDLLVCAKFEDEQWYRACVTTVDGDKCRLHYIDYGNYQESSVENIRILRKEFTSLHPFAYCCQLFNLEPVESPWKPESCNLLRKLEGVSHKYEILSRNRPYSVVIEFNGVNLSENLKLSGFGKDTVATDFISAFDVSPSLKFELTSVSDSTWLFHIEDYRTTVNLLNHDMAYFLANKPPQSNVSENTPCAAFVLGTYHRAKVIECISSTKCKVLLVDWNREETTSISDIKSLPKDFATFPIQCIKCRLTEEDLALGNAEKIRDTLLTAGASIKLHLVSPMDDEFCVQIDAVGDKTLAEALL